MSVWSEWIIRVKSMVYVRSYNRGFIEQYVSFSYSQLIGAHVFHHATQVNGYATRRPWMYNGFQIIFTWYSYGFKVVSEKIIDVQPPSQMNFSFGLQFWNWPAKPVPNRQVLCIVLLEDNIKFQHSTSCHIGSFYCLFRGRNCLVRVLKI